MDFTIAYPKMDDIKTALFIQPHPDDNEIGAGGTMAYLVKKGVKVYGLTVTQGRGGSNDPAITPEMLGGIRQKEAQAAMDITGTVNLGDLGYHDQNPATHEQLVKDFVRVIREVKPDAIFTVDPDLPNEMHPIHIQTGKALCEAFMRCGQPYYPYEDNRPHPDAFSVKIIGFYFTSDDNTTVDITDYIETKMEAIRAHQSQMDEQQIQMFYSLFEMMAYNTSYKYAERFKLLDATLTHCFAIPKELKAKLNEK